MASTSAIALPSLFRCGSKSHLGDLRKLLVPSAATHFANLRKIDVPAAVGGRAVPGLGRRGEAIVAKAVGDSSDSSSVSIVEYFQDAWSKSEDRIALVGLGFAAIAAVWASSNLIAAIDQLPLIPSVLEFIGILFSWWFIYRYLLFKPDRVELVEKVKSSLSDVLGK